MNVARSETMQLYKHFLRLRHHFPNKQGRSTLRRWTNALFSLRQLEYDTVATRAGRAQADREAAEWRVDARADLGTFDVSPSHLLLRQNSLSELAAIDCVLTAGVCD